jgi:hypothetical protein
VKLEFEWDEEKADANFEQHEVDFEDAVQVFFDRRRIVREDRRRDYGEQRLQTIGSVGGELFFVVYTLRGRVHRLISARPATSAERSFYHGKRQGEG